MLHSDWKKGDKVKMNKDPEKTLGETMKAKLSARYKNKSGHYRAHKTGIALKLIAVNQDGTSATFAVE